MGRALFQRETANFDHRLQNARTKPREPMDPKIVTRHYFARVCTIAICLFFIICSVARADNIESCHTSVTFYHFIFGETDRAGV
jgi:hypothetical protein